MGESYVRPVTGAREPRPEWVALWRFRVVALLLLVAAGAGTAWGINEILHLGDSNPTNEVPFEPAVTPPP